MTLVCFHQFSTSITYEVWFFIDNLLLAITVEALKQAVQISNTRQCTATTVALYNMTDDLVSRAPKDSLAGGNQILQVQLISGLCYQLVQCLFKTYLFRTGRLLIIIAYYFLQLYQLKQLLSSKAHSFHV